MRHSVLQFGFIALFSATGLFAGPRYQENQEQQQRQEARRQREEERKAMGIAAVEVGGSATGARRIDLNGATGGWEVFVSVQRDKSEWIVVVDRDTWTVRRKTRLKN